MNLKVDALEAGKAQVEVLLAAASAQVGAAIQTIARLQMEGIRAARGAGVDEALIGQVLDYAGRANACVSHAALMLQGVHASLHEALERLSPTEERSGPGDKTPPPKP